MVRTTVVLNTILLQIIGLTVLMLFPSHGHAQPVQNVYVEVWTSNDYWSGTDNDVFIHLWSVKNEPFRGQIAPPSQVMTLLDSPADDHERGDVRGYYVNFPPGIDECDIVGFDISKSPDDGDGGWKLAHVRLYVNGIIRYDTPVNQWIHNGNLLWHAPNYQQQECPFPLVFDVPIAADAPWDPCLSYEKLPGDPEIPPLRRDADCDGTPDEIDTVWDPPDTDNDGVVDPMEDFNHNGVVDPGETDPNNADTDGDGIVDSRDYADYDNDCLPDVLEDRNRNQVVDPGETDWRDNDTDDDGWVDGTCNMTTILYLTGIDVLDQQEDIELGKDELFLTINHARHPLDIHADGRWSLHEQSLGFDPWLPVAVRARGFSERLYFVRIDVREDDWFDWTDDNMILDRDVIFGDQGSFMVEYKKDSFWNDIHYRFHFTAVPAWMADPHPLNADADEDRDGLTEAVEFRTINNVVGAGHPMFPDIYMELDSVGSDQQPERYTKEDICTVFTTVGFDFHLDDGIYGGGQILPYTDTVDKDAVWTYRQSNFSPERCGIFHYALAVNELGGTDDFGRGSKPTKNNLGETLCGSGDALIWTTDLWDHVTDFESILWIHEFGHNLGLCHPDGQKEPTVKQNPQDGCIQCGQKPKCNCTHYFTGYWEDTAMGDGFDWWNPGDWYRSADREIYYAPQEWAVIDPTPINRNLENLHPCP